MNGGRVEYVTEQCLEVAWISGQSEYRPTEYLQQWVRFWFDDALRLAAARRFQLARMERLTEHWENSKALKEQGFSVQLGVLRELVQVSTKAINTAPVQKRWTS